MDFPPSPQLWLPAKPAIVRAHQGDLDALQALERDHGVRAMLPGLAPLAMLAGGSTAPAKEYISSYGHASTSGSDFTFTAANLGPAFTGRRLVIGTYGRGSAGGNRTVSSITVGGVAMTLAATRTANSACMVQGHMELDTGTSADVVVTFSGAMNGCGIGIYSLANVSPTIHAEASSVTNSTTIDVPEGGIVTGFYADRSTVTDFTWTGLTEDFEELSFGDNALNLTGASDIFESAEVGRALSIAGGTGLDDVITAVSWSPA